VLQCVAVCSSALQCVPMRCSVLQCVAVCCSVLQYVTCCSVLQGVAVKETYKTDLINVVNMRLIVDDFIITHGAVALACGMQRVAVCCSVFAVCCSVLRSVAECCRVLQ